MTPELDYSVEQENNRGRIVGRDASGNEAELTFVLDGHGKLLANHTGVPKALEGKGVGSALVKHLAAYVREHDLKVVPNCSFVRHKMMRSETLRDLIAD